MASVFYIENLSPSDIELLTQLLSLTPGYAFNGDSSWLLDQTHLLSTFPPSLLKPSSLLSRIAVTLPFSPGKAHLCLTHKPLNAHLIRRTFLDVSAECTTHLERLVQNPCLPPYLEAFVKRLQSVNSLWMSPELYRSVFLHLPGTDFRPERIASGCEACILASVGGDHQILSDLRSSMLGRRKRNYSHPPLLEMVEAWIDWTGRDDIIRSESDVLGKEIGKYRRQMQKARRQKRQNVADGIKDEDHGHEAESETWVDEKEGGGKVVVEGREWKGVEESIIDFYAKQMSTTSYPHKVTEGLHEAFREYIVFDPISRAFRRVVSQGGESKAPKPYTESVYSTTTGLQTGCGSEKYAQSYQNLLGILEDDEEPRARTNKP